MNCNTCHRTGRYLLKLGFAQKKRVDGGQRWVFSFEAEGLFCIECKGRIERETKFGNFQSVMHATLREEVATFFGLRGWGEPCWEDTSIEFIDRANELGLPSAPIEKLVS